MPETGSELLAKLPQEKIDMIEKAFMQLATSNDGVYYAPR